MLAKSFLGNRTKECGEQLVESRDEVGGRGKGVAGVEFFKRETSMKCLPHLHQVVDLWVKPTVEMGLGHFIDPAHQSGHPHRRFSRKRKL